MVRSSKFAEPTSPGSRTTILTESSPPSAESDRLLEAIEHQNLDYKIYVRLRSLILERRLLPGERIQVDRLARSLGVSRTPVVNGLKRLAQEHVVECVPRRGSYVKRFTTREMIQLYEVREVLEGLSTRLAASQIKQEEVDRLETMFRSLDVTPNPAAAQEYIERDRYFHWRIVEIAGNEQLTRALQSVNMMSFTWQNGLVRPAAETIQEHYAILAALRSQDPVASEAAMRLHIRRSVERLKQEEVEENLGQRGRRETDSLLRTT